MARSFDRNKKRLLGTPVFNIARYGSECWAIKRSDGEKVKAFEMRLD